MDEKRVKYYKCKYLFPNCSNFECIMTAFDIQLIINAFINKRSFPTPPTISRFTWHPKSGCHVTSLCQGLRRSAGSGGEDPENQVELLCALLLCTKRRPGTRLTFCCFQFFDSQTYRKFAIKGRDMAIGIKISKTRTNVSSLGRAIKAHKMLGSLII